ncbi:MAG: aldehyde dehydrogenase [Phycisphaeraceae bacterium]|nr:aldehyde dehydrogenase [Phycisphaeraceae bacterium]
MTSATTTTSAPSEPPGVLESFNPATGEVVGAVPMTAVEAIPGMVARACAVQRRWADVPAAQRAEMLRPAAKVLKSRAEEIGTLLCREMGKPIKEAIGEVSYAADSFAAELDEIVAAIEPEHLVDEKTETTLHFDPLGVCAAITPWNFPVLMPQENVVPALVAGNAVLLKPSELTPLVARAWTECVTPSLPPDVLQLIFGDERQGRALVSADVDLIAFTGSRSAGQNIMKAAAGGLKRLVLELGGKDPLVVLRDADLEAAATFAVRNSFRNAGQVCVSTERIYVDRSIAERFKALVIEKAKALVQGPGSDEGVTIGPMVSREQKEKVDAAVRRAVEQGARVLLGGDPKPGDNFYPPTVLDGLDHTKEIMREETFGPVACIMEFDSENDAASLANDTPYGLGAAVFSRDVERARAFARRLHSGMIGINQGCGGAKGSPWVGAKQSGFGFHSGPLGHRQFTQVRTVSMPKVAAPH